ncbi:hypothetical protein BCR36DRAFT_463024 [Piromyces finnis]|uniref:Uncharacterized protein n=1 Tax=Piromyces finnis TaxID=1754191 RepID=A0A1Y1UWV0_9FUNG|nr:hypothetical protein BCR36DRAFT_463024 [Piromyces finnis]|eukprot:ORX42628.1 hypothetical protein BCR36DRAFT_463024 [Piromyces finnis]
MLESLSLIENLIYENTAGKYPTYFCAPRGEINVMLFEEFNYKVIQWDTDTNDWNKVVNGVQYKKFNARFKTVKDFLINEYNKKKERYLVLMHDVKPHTVKDIVGGSPPINNNDNSAIAGDIVQNNPAIINNNDLGSTGISFQVEMLKLIINLKSSGSINYTFNLYIYTY